MTRAKQLIRFGVAGAAFFWGPDVLVHAVAGAEFSRVHVWVVTFLMPVSALAGFLWLSRRQRHGWLALAMLAGFWMLGGLAMAINASLDGGSFFEAPLGGLFLAVVGVLPPMTFVMSTYDGSLGALVVGSVVFAVLAVWSGWGVARKVV